MEFCNEILCEIYHKATPRSPYRHLELCGIAIKFCNPLYLFRFLC
ncbi:MAG: hypothetical protein WBO61_01600 [Gemmiger qucibialis]